MELSQTLAAQIGVALNEARLLGVEVDASRRLGGATFQVLTLPDFGPPPDDRRIQMLFLDVGRCTVSLPTPNSTADSFTPQPIQLEELLSCVQKYGGQPIYGWNFINTPPQETAEWRERLSLDWRDPKGSTRNCISLFQGVVAPCLEIWLWFESLETYHPSGTPVPLEFCAGGRRWWDALHSGDGRAAGYGIYPLKPSDA